MLDWGGVSSLENVKILDVGCGIGGTTRYMASLLPNSRITGITLSPEQASRATKLAAERGVDNAEFQVMDALSMDFEDESFDVVWGCESGEHMPDKTKYVTEMSRVLKPGGRMVIATWCQRDNATQSFTAEEERSLDFLYSRTARIVLRRSAATPRPRRGIVVRRSAAAPRPRRGYSSRRRSRGAAAATRI